MRRKFAAYRKIPEISDIYSARKIYYIVPTILKGFCTRNDEAPKICIGTNIHNSRSGESRRVIVALVYREHCAFSVYI